MLELGLGIIGFMDESGMDSSIVIGEVGNIKLNGADRYISTKQKEGVPYQVKERITRQIGSMEELEQFFESEGAQTPEHLNRIPNAEYSGSEPEFVQLAQVAGGAEAARYDGTFLVYPKGKESEGRGRERVWEICQSYAGGRNLDPNKPQEFYEYDGKYYVTSGRHSTAALKALGVNEIPAMVVHVKSG